MPGKGSYILLYIIIESLTIYPIYLILLYSNSTSTLLHSANFASFSYRFILADLSIGVFLWIAISSLAPVGLLMSGYGSNNKI